MHHVVDEDLPHCGQHGGVPGRDSATPAFIQEMQHETARASRKSLFSGDFDATACHDRIVPSVASLAARSHGQHQTLCLAHAEFLSEAKCLLKTHHTHSGEIRGTEMEVCPSAQQWRRKDRPNRVPRLLALTSHLEQNSLLGSVSCLSTSSNGVFKQDRSKVIDMCFCWLADRAQQKQHDVCWDSGKRNLADHFAKHHPPSHHKQVRPICAHTKRLTLHFPRVC